MKTLCLTVAAVLTAATVAVAVAPRAAAGPVFVTRNGAAFDDAAAMNLTVIRAWTSLECGGKLDYLLAKANQLGLKLIMPFVNNWRDFGGMDQYVTWHGLRFHDQFYTDASIKQNYRDWIAALVNRTNSITGVRYKDDPAIFSWELANEPRCINASLPTSGTCTADTLVSWATEMSRFIKSLDGNHMVSVGDEGFHPGVGGTAGSWPYNVTDGVDHKPEILEEFGSTDQSTRDATYTAWTDAVRTGGGDGWNFWLLTGIQDDGQLYPDFDGFRVATPSATVTVLSNAAVSWAASTDAGLAGYTVYRRQGAVDTPLTQSATNTVSLTGLAPSTCRVGYEATNWGGSNGFTANVTITNTGQSTITGWTLAFRFTAGFIGTNPAPAAVTCVTR